MELLLKVITDTLNVVPESFYDKCSNLDLGTTYRRTRVDGDCFLNDVKPSGRRETFLLRMKIIYGLE